MSNSFIYSTGLGNVGSYQVAGTPYLTSSNILNQEKQFSFPYITKSIILENTGSNDIFFRFSEDVNGHFKLPSAKKVELDVKCSFISASAGTGIQLYASLTNIERTKLLPEATLFSTASAGGSAPLPSPAPFNDDDGDGLSNEEEADIGSDPNDSDTDDDTLPDGSDPDPLKADADEDGTGDASDPAPTNPLVGGTPADQLPTFNSFSALTRVQNASAPGGDLQTFLLTGVTATDVDTNPVTNIIVTNLADFQSPFSWSTIANYTINIQATDSEGRTASTTRALQITEDLAPVITVNPLGNIELGTANATAETAFSGSIVSVVDDVDGVIPNGNVGISHDYDVATATHGDTITVNYSVQDSFGNTGTAQNTTLVQDTVAPVFNAFSDLDVSIGSDPDDANYLAGVSATDFSTPITFSVNSDDEDTSGAGSYNVTLFATDSVGNSTSTTRTVNVLADSVPVLTLTRVTPAGSIIQNGGIVQTNNFYLVDHPNGGKSPSVSGCTGVAVHAGTQPQLNLGGTRYGDAYTASLAINDEFTSDVLYLDGTGDYVEFPESTGATSTWSTRYCNGNHKYDLLPAFAAHAGATPQANYDRFHETIGWFQFDQLHTGSGTQVYTIMNKRDPTNFHGYEIFMELTNSSGTPQAKLVYRTDANADNNSGTQVVRVDTSYKDVSTDLWYMFRITTKNDAAFSGNDDNIRLRAAFGAQNETGSFAFNPGSFSSQTSTHTTYNTTQLRIGANQNGGQAFNGKFLRIYRWFGLEGANFKSAADSGTQSTDGGIQDWVVAAHMALDQGSNVQADNTETFADPFASSSGGETVTSNWTTVMGSATGPYSATGGPFGNGRYIIEYSASNAEGTGYAYRTVTITT
jgi:hypothetical protein